MPLGLDYNRTMLILAVLEKRAYMPFYTFDVYVTVMGGLKLTEPSSDLAVALALASSYKNEAVAGDVCAFGEIGLTGEIRPVTQTEKRVDTAIKLGYKKVLLPARNAEHLEKYAKKIEIIPIKHIYQAIKYLFNEK